MKLTLRPCQGTCESFPHLCSATVRSTETADTSIYLIWASLTRNSNPSLASFEVGLLKGTLEPLIQVTADLRISVEILALSHVMTSLYLWSVFSARVVASCLRNIWHSFPIPPFVPKTRGVKTPCSTFRMRSRYSLFLLFSWFLKMVWVDLPAWLEELTCVTRMSKNAVWFLCQKPLALTSNLASELVFAVLCSKVSFVTGRRCGSTWTSLHTFVKRLVNRSRRLSCLCAIKPPFLQFSACSTLKVLPHGQVEGRFFILWL